ncbi:hypothetical protein [Kouleothrix sp.]|uniref:hypothetical protein n=1 Tax=Kouleothrix sp. TaxID=2779161 RepID=UPI00391CEBC8
MNLSGSVIRIVVLALPGIISALLYWRLRGRSEHKDWEDFLLIGLFSFFIYLVYGAGINLLARLGFSVYPPKAFEALTDDKLAIPWGEIPEATLIGVVIAVLAAYADKYNLVGKFGYRIGASSRLHDKELWHTFLAQPNQGWVYVRDHKLQLVYYGWLFQYSDADKDRELVLRDVKVYSEQGHLYTSPLMYISRDKHDLTIEFTPTMSPVTNNTHLEDEKMSDNQNQSPAVKVIAPVITQDVTPDFIKSHQNPAQQTPRPAAEPVVATVQAAPAAAAPAAAAQPASPAAQPAAQQTNGNGKE